MSFAISSAYAYSPVYSGYTKAAVHTSKAAALNFDAPVSAVPETYSNEQTERRHVSLEDISKEVLNVLEKMRSSANRNANFLNPKDLLIPTDDLYGGEKGSALGGTAGEMPFDTGFGTEAVAVSESDEPVHVYYDEKYAADDINHDGRISPSECSTCRERMYVDGSDEDNVSFKAPGHIAPQASAAVVSAHEHEHVANAVSKGMEEGVELLSASVSLQTAVCPECCTVYVSGGTTRTSFRETSEQ